MTANILTAFILIWIAAFSVKVKNKVKFTPEKAMKV